MAKGDVPRIDLPIHSIDDIQPRQRGRYLVWDAAGDASTAWWDAQARLFKQGAVGRSVRWWAGPLPEAPEPEDTL